VQGVSEPAPRVLDAHHDLRESEGPVTGFDGELLQIRVLQTAVVQVQPAPSRCTW
jgi:hypothetical protein